MTTRCFTDIAGQVKAPTARLKLALESGLLVTALDGLFWLGTQRIAADVQRLRQSGMVIVTREVEYQTPDRNHQTGFCLHTLKHRRNLCYRIRTDSEIYHCLPGQITDRIFYAR